MNIDPDVQPVIQARLRVLKMLATALIGGVVIFAAIVAVTVTQRSTGGGTPSPGGGPSADMMRIIAGVLLFSAIAASTVIAMVVPKQCRAMLAHDQRGNDRDHDQMLLLARFFTARLMSLALFEGAALFITVVVLLHGQMLDLIFTGVAVLAMLIQFPTAGRWRRFLETCTGDPPGHMS